MTEKKTYTLYKQQVDKVDFHHFTINNYDTAEVQAANNIYYENYFDGDIARYISKPEARAHWKILIDDGYMLHRTEKI